MIKAVIFDLDGTLMDSVPNILLAARVTFGKLGIDYNEDEMRKAIGVPTKAQGKMFAGDRAQDFIDLYREEYRSLEQPLMFKGTVEMLDNLISLGYRLALVTSKVSSSTHKSLKVFNIDDRFELVVGADQVTNAKPHPEPILKAVELLGINTDEAIYVGDSAFDVESAKSANVKVIAVSWGARSKESLLALNPEVVVDSWDEMIEWINSI